VGGVFSVVFFAEVAQSLSLWWWVWAVPAGVLRLSADKHGGILT